MDPLPASYYGKIDNSNPVVLSFKRDLKEFKLQMRKVRESQNFDHSSYSRGSMKLFDIWKKYKPRLPARYYEERLLQTADFLFESKFYRLAQWQGYRHYLHQFCTADLESIKDVDCFRQSFFPEGFDTEGAKLMFRALQGECLCTFHVERERFKWLDQSGMQKLISILAFLRIMMQAILPYESLCWLLYNGSLHMYTICRFLMSVNQAAQALEFLQWACVCLETSVPLLTSSFLPWRATLYCAVCECYYNDQAAIQAEEFARRALGKISELGKLEEMHDVPSSSDTQRAFKEATIKLAVMIFKRSAYEPRKKAKGLFRSKQKSSLKEGHNVPWPRTMTERILMELFEGNAAQFLALLEALWDSSCRPLHTGISDEPEIHEVALELMSAGISILSGNGGSSRQVSDDSLPPSLSAITSTYTLMEMATAGENQVSVDAAVKFVKLIFRYEQWDTFRILSDNLMTLLSNLEGRFFRKAELELTLLEALEHFMSTHRVRLGTKDFMTELLMDKDKGVGPVTMTDELQNLVQTLHVCVCEATQDIQPDGDIVLDIVLFVWAKCKLVFQRAQARHYDPVRYLGKTENQNKWVQTLFLLCEVAYVCQLPEIDPVMVAEMTLRLAMVLESGAELPQQSDTKRTSAEDCGQQSPRAEKHTAMSFKRSQAEQLEMVCGVLERGLEYVSRGTVVSLPYDSSIISDTVFLQKFGGSHVKSSESVQMESTSTSSIRSLSMDLYVDLLASLHRVSLKLLDTYSDEDNAEERKRSVAQTVQGQPCDAYSKKARKECLLLEKIKKNKISKALFLLQKALLLHKNDPNNRDTKKLLEPTRKLDRDKYGVEMCLEQSQSKSEDSLISQDAATLMEKAKVKERRLASASVPAGTGSVENNKCTPPPPPVLLSCTSQSMTFTPAPYTLEEKVCWYRIYGRKVDGLNFKVRIGDNHLPGTGDTIPSRGECLFYVNGLEPNQQYVFAVAAFDAQGNLIGNTIGETTRPLLASLPLPLLITWAHLAQVSYQTGQHALAKKACCEIWNQFTLPPVSDPGASQERKIEQHLEGLAQTRLRPETLEITSPLMQHFFLLTIFIQTDIHIQERSLHCDSLCGESSFIWGQEARLAECERMLVAIDLALHLNDSNAALQAIVSCYGLLTPLVYYQIPSYSVIEVLLKCLMVLQEIPAVLKQKRPAATTESLQHMVACITHYVAKSLRTFKEYCMASSVIYQGKKLLKEITESVQQPTSRPVPVEQDGREKLQKAATIVHEEELSEELKALEGTALKHKKARILDNCDVTTRNKAGSQSPDLTGREDPVVLYAIIGCSSLRTAFIEVMKFKQRPHFMEFALLLLQRALQEDQLELLSQCGQEIFSWLIRRDEGLTVPKKPQEMGKDLKKFTTSVIEYSNKKQKVRSFQSDKKKLQKSSGPGPGAQTLNMWHGKDVKAVETLLKLLAPLIRRHQHRRRLRHLCSEEWAWRCHINLTLAQAYLGLLRKSVKPQVKANLQHCYSKMPLLLFSLAHTGTIVKWKNIPQNVRPTELNRTTPKAMPQPEVMTSLKATINKAKDTSQGAHNIIGEMSEEREVDSEQDSPRTQLTNNPDRNETAAAFTQTHCMVLQPLDTLCKATVHLRRAMVLAHRGGLWTSLQWVCRVLWDQFSTMALLIERGQIFDSAATLTLDQFYIIFTPLLVLASDLLMDMMERRKQWKVYDEEGEEMEARPLGDEALVDLRWLRNLLLHTLELLFHQAKWETLAHLALLYNSKTREYYTHIISPVLVHAQRRLLERISYFGGPPVPQPHFIHTETASGEKITCRNYADRQLFLPRTSGAESQHRGKASGASPESLEQSEVKRAMCVVRVPLDIDDTLHCFRETLAKSQHTLRLFQHSRTLLLLLLAGTQHSMEVPFCKEFCSGLQDRVEFDIAATTQPSIGPPDLINEDFSSVGSVFSSPLPPSHIQTVLSSYNTSIKYLQANKYNSLQVHALHDLGNLHFYKGNQKAAHSHWSKALDCALQTTGVLESWDGESWASSSSQQPLKHAGIWGCLQGAVLSAKISQYILTSNISQRTTCCLLSAKLFKCLLRASLPHPDNDLEYCSYSLNIELIPGLDLFSEPEGGVASGAVASLGFLCHWLYTSGHHLVVLPLLALYQYIASKVCHDPHHTISCRILKVKVLTELGLFAEAVREIYSLTLGEEDPLSRSYSKADKAWAQKTFTNSKPLIDPSNLQVIEDVVNRRPSEDVMALYGTRQTYRLFLAKIQLILAMCSTIYDLPEPLSPEVLESQVSVNVTSAPGLPNHGSEESACNSPTMNSREPKGLQLDPLTNKLTLGQLKALILREASCQLSGQLLALQNIYTDPEELELTVETRLLLSSLCVQQGKIAYSADLAVSALKLLQESPLFQSENPPQLLPRAPTSTLRQSSAKTKPHQMSPLETEPAPDPESGDMSAGVEATERMDRFFWLRCRLSVVQSLTAHVPGTAIYPGVDSSVEAAKLLQEGLAEAEAWGDPDTHALLLLYETSLNTHCGKAPVESASILQKAVSLLSGRTALSLRSSLALAKATLLLSELRGSGSQPFYLLTQRLLQQQLCTLGENIVLKARGGLELCSGPVFQNIYYPQLPLLARTTMHLGHCLAVQAMMSSSEDLSKSWHSAQEVLQSALVISQASACRDHQLESDILYCKGMVERILMSLNEFQYQRVVECFLESVTLTHSHSHNLQLIHRCHMEMALIYLQQWQKSTTLPKPPPTSTPAKSDKQLKSWRHVRSSLSKNLTVGQCQVLLFWVCLRAATKTMEAITSASQLCGLASSIGGPLPLTSLKALPEFTINDLLNPCGGLVDPFPFWPSSGPDKESKLSSRDHAQLTWVHLSRYYAHLVNLRHISTRPVAERCVEGLMTAAGDLSLSLKLAQLHTFFSCHLEAYREQCVLPDPPTVLILEPQTLQLSHTVKLSVCQPKEPVPDLYPWATVNTQQLCIQWYKPTLELSRPTPNTIILVFALNKAPLSAMHPIAVAITELEGGQRQVPIDRLKALHDQLMSACVKVKVTSAVSASPAPSTTPSFSSKQESQLSSKSSELYTSRPQQQMLLEETKRICTEITNLLKPESKSHIVTEVPFKPSVQALYDLECCFNPATGAIVVDKALGDWLFSLLF